MKSLLPTVLLFLGAASASGQAILTGKATDRASGTPVPGVVVSGIDSAGQVVTRGITDLANGYRMVLVAHLAKIQFRRIGYGRVERAITDTSAEHLDVIMDRLPIVLPPVRALQQAQCDPRPDQEQANAYWEQARSGLTTSIVARETKAAWISMLLYAYQLQDGKEMPRRVQRFELASSPNGFVAAADPRWLEDHGYLETRGMNNSYLAPDEVVLADDSFLETHCLSLADLPKGDDSTVGLHFEPAKKRKVVEIDGTIWLRKDPLELKSIEYRYVNVDKDAQRAEVGGSINFRTMPNGIAMIDRWRIRAISAVLESTGPTAAPTGAISRGAGSRAQDPPPRARTVTKSVPSETGSIIELLQWPGAPPYVANLATVHGVVRDPETKRVVPNATVTFASTPYQTKSDSTGSFTLTDVLPGTYNVYTDDQILDAYGASAPFPPPRVVHDGANDFGDLEAESAEALVKRNCRDKVVGRINTPQLGNGALFGLIRQGGTHDIRMEVRPTNAVAGSPPLVFKGKTDPIGRFRACFLPTPAKVWIVSDENRSASGQGEAVFEATTAFQLVPIDLTKKPPQ